MLVVNFSKAIVVSADVDDEVAMMLSDCRRSLMVLLLLLLLMMGRNIARYATKLSVLMVVVVVRDEFHIVMARVTT